MAIKVLFVGNYDIPLHNIRPEAEMIIGLKQRGLDVEVVTQADCYYAKRMSESGIRVHDYTPPAKFSLKAVWRLRHILRSGRHNVIQLFNNKAIVAGVHAAIGLPVKVVTYRGQTGNISRFDPVSYLTHLSPGVDRIICVAEAVRQSLLPQVRNPDKLVTIYKGHDIQWYTGIEPARLELLGVPPGSFVVTCVANNRPRKGIPQLIAAVGLLPADSRIHVVLVGGGMDGREVRELLATSPGRARITALGSRADVLPIVAASNATVLPALKREGLPKSIIESMALGIPPIVTSTGGSPELVIDRESGLVVPPGHPDALASAMLEISSNPGRAQAMGQRSRERIISNFNLDASISRHIALFEQLLGGEH